MNITKKAFFITILVSGSIFACEERPNDLQSPSAELKTTFGVIQKIHGLAAQVAKDAAKQSGTDIALEAKTRPESDPNWGQTKQGLYLRVEQYPSALDSPWGRVKIFDGYSFGRFRNNMRLKFVGNTCEKRVRHGNREIEFYKANHQTPIKLKELEKYRGTDTPILASECGCESVYEIESFKGIKLPKAEPLPFKNYRKSDDVKKSWDELMRGRVETLDQESR